MDNSSSTIRFGIAKLVRPPCEIFTPHFIDFKPIDCNFTLKGLLLIPVIKDSPSAKLPLIQAVYCGPSIQMIRDNWFRYFF